MPEPTHDADAHDTSLARVLHARSAATVEVLQASLAEARRRRALGGSSEDSSLAAVISERALVAAPVLEEANRAISGEHATGTMTGGAVSSDALRPPRDGFALPPQLGPFRLRRELARGGMGAVWEVEHIDSGGVYALKTILAAGRLEGPGGEAMARFRREVELGARLDHPNVVRVHSADVEGDPPWLVQTYLPGGSLDERLKRQGPLPVDEAAAITAKVARGLAHAHARGVLHRDLKPPNVLFDAEGEPRVVDFGVARSLREGTMRLTATGEVLGSPAYMAPEQALGEKAVDARADVHALGALLYALLTGGPPFKAKTSLEVIEQVISKPAPPPSAERAGVPPALDAVVLRCLEKEPAARFQTADEVAAALEALLEPVDAPARRAPVAILAAVAAVAIAAAGLALTRAGGHAPPGAPVVAPPPRPTVPPPPAPTEAAPASPSVAPMPTSWLETFQADEVFGFGWEDDVAGPPGGLTLTFRRLAVVEEEDALRLRLKVERLAYWTAMNLTTTMTHDSKEGPHKVGGLDGCTRKAFEHVNACAEAELELRIARRTGAVLELTGVPEVPVLTPDELRDVAAPLCLRLTGYLSTNFLGAQFDNLFRVLPRDASPDGRWVASRKLVATPAVTLNVRLETRPRGASGRYELAPPPGTLFDWQSDLREPRKSRATGSLQVEGGRIVESCLALEVECATAARDRRTLHWKFRWTRGEPPPPPRNTDSPLDAPTPPGGR